MASDSQEVVARTSRLRPGFGSTTPQRKVHVQYGKGVPGPGAYEPVRSLSASNRLVTP